MRVWPCRLQQKNRACKCLKTLHDSVELNVQDVVRSDAVTTVVFAEAVDVKLTVDDLSSVWRRGRRRTCTVYVHDNGGLEADEELDGLRTVRSQAW